MDDSNIDPFPPSLPQIHDGSPQILDLNMEDDLQNMGIVDYYNGANAFDLPDGPLYGIDTHDTAMPSPPRATKQTSVARDQIYDSTWSHYPESSSGSDSSKRHKRKNSSESSSPPGLKMADTSEPDSIMIQANLADERESEKWMEEAFDFASAASSPVPQPVISQASRKISGSGVSDVSTKAVSSPGNASEYRPYVGAPDQRITKSTSQSPPSVHAKEMKSPILEDTQRRYYSPSAFELHVPPSVNHCYTTREPYANVQPYAQNAQQVIPFVSQQPSSSVSPPIHPGLQHDLPTIQPPDPPMLHLGNLRTKTRVETQSNAKLMLDPVPSHVRKLHLQPHTLSKPKQVVRPTPEPSPDTYELYATVVCASAMLNQEKRQRALNRAAQPRRAPMEEGGSSSAEAVSPETTQDQDKPSDGGPVSICSGCIERDRKRANRKRTKTGDEVADWEKNEDRRIIVFNTHEIKEWQPLTSAKHTVPGAPESFAQPEDYPQFSPSAMQIDLPTRIACYGRHHDEKIGFHIILTVRDHLDHLVAQTMSRPIQVTDDHKSSAPNHQSVDPWSDHVDRFNLPGAGVFNQAPVGHPGMMVPIPRNAFSATDLYGLQSQYNPLMAGQVRATTTAQQQSGASPATMTPRNLSRPASPTMPCGPQNKRRKGSNSSKMINDLRMTPAYPVHQSTSNGPYASTFPTYPPVAGGASGLLSDFSSPPLGSSMRAHVPQLDPIQTTQVFGDLNISQIGHRSRSMDHLPDHNDFRTAPFPAEPAMRATPISDTMSVGTIQSSDSASEVRNFHLPGSNSTNTQEISQPAASIYQGPPAIMNKLTPAEGSTAGGYEVICLGSGFKKGMQVMFGAALAITIELWGESAITCIVPPSLHPCEVDVTFKHLCEQQPPVPMAIKQTFRYVKNDQPELLAQLLSMLGAHINPQDLQQGGARSTAQQLLSHGASVATATASDHSSDQNHQTQGPSSMMSDGEVEEVMLRCLELLDLDETPRQIDYNVRRPKNGQGMLHLAASLGYYRVAAGLLARGAHPDIRDGNGMSPMHMAALRGHARIIRKLRSAGGDPNLRSLAGFIPLDMATTAQTQHATSVIEYQTSPQSSGATPITSLSRATSVMSRASSHGDVQMVPCDDTREVRRSGPVDPAHIRARSRRTSYSVGKHESARTDALMSSNASRLATQSALTAWRDQLSAQIQQFQQTVHRALPPLPNLPDYQGYPVVRRISSLVPQRTLGSTTGNDEGRTAKEAEIGWWELLTGSTASPPAYEDIYPAGSQEDMPKQKRSILQAASEALTDRTRAVAVDQAESSRDVGVVSIGRKGLTQQQRDRLRTAHAHKMKRLRSDRKLFFVWIPLLLLVIMMMLKDKLPGIMYGTHRTYTFLRDHYRDRFVEVA